MASKKSGKAKSSAVNGAEEVAAETEVAAPAKARAPAKSKAKLASGSAAEAKVAKSAAKSKGKAKSAPREYPDAEIDEDERKAKRGSGHTLVVVESPAKAKTIKKYLGSAYTVKASVGHVMDLPKSKIGVDVENGFLPVYEVIESKQKVLGEIRNAAKKADRVLLATDPDREGEAIAWHLSEAIKGAHVPMWRVLFNEITKPAIQEAIAHPIALRQEIYDAQQARRVLDRLVGYQISPILWDKVRRGLSAGRVQSVAVRLVVDREAEIKKFIPVEYWSIEADLKAALPPQFRAKLIKVDGKKAELTSAGNTQPLAAEVEKEKFVVATVDRKERRRNAPPPFITSKLQQEAANRLGFSPKKTMTLAQKLYEGVELGDEGQTALITYMRTDSVRLSPASLEMARAWVSLKYGKQYLPEGPVQFKTKKSAQDAHEAIRPVSTDYSPERVKKHLEHPEDRDLFRLYELIWNRFIASQMVPAVFDQTTADIAAGRATFRATGQVLKFAGYLGVYGEQAVKDGSQPPEEAGAEKMEGDDEEKGDLSRQLPPLDEGHELKLAQLITEQHFTQPPPRFSEATLVKEMEDRGIGRPSTYAAILSTIQAEGREYVEKKENRLYPTYLGTLITELLLVSFPTVMDVEFTAKMEESLDEVEEGKVDWVKLMGDFYGPFQKSLVVAKSEMRDVKREEVKTSLVCEKCGSPMVIKLGKMGRFLACTGYPECKNTCDFTEAPDGTIKKVEPQPTDEICPKCDSPMVSKRGRFGVFLACSTYPTCDYTKPITIKGVACPLDGGGLAERKSRFGKSFYGCVNYPACKFAAWDRPIPGPCPTCGALYLLSKYSKRDGAYTACPNKECDYRRATPEEVQPGEVSLPPPPAAPAT